MGRTMKRPSLTAWILIGLVAGIAFGAAFPAPAVKLGLLGTIFLRLIKSIIAPLLFGTLVSGIAGTGNVKTMGRIGGKAILYFEIVTTVALFVGLGAVNLVQPGVGVQLQKAPRRGVAQTSAGLEQILEHTFPVSIIDSMARGEVLADRGVLLPLRHGLRRHRIQGRPGGWILRIAFRSDVPIHQLRDAVRSVGRFRSDGGYRGRKGLGVLANLGKLVGTLYAAEVFFVVVVLGTVTAIARIPAPALHRARQGAVPDRLLDRIERSRAAAGARKHGALRRAEAHRVVRAADWATASIWTARRYTWRWRRCSSRRPPAFTCHSARSW